jgi:hypothetical protein
MFITLRIASARAHEAFGQIDNRKGETEMSNGYLTAEEQREIQRDVSKALRAVHTKHANRDRASIAEVENPNRQIQKSDCEKAISGLHSKHESRREIRKLAPKGTNGAAAIAALHSDRSFAGRRIDSPTLVAKLAGAVTQAIRKDYGSAAEAKAEIKKLLADEPRPRNHEVVKRARCKSGEAILLLKKGASYPFEIVVADGEHEYYHSSHLESDGAERAFLVLTGCSD